MKEKQYKIQGHTFRMGEMTLGQDKKLLQLLGGREIDFEKMTGLQATINYLLQNDLIDGFLNVILRGDIESIEIEEITNSQLEEIISDFFGLNGGWIKKLNVLLHNFLSGMNQTIHLSNSKISRNQNNSMTE